MEQRETEQPRPFSPAIGLRWLALAVLLHDVGKPPTAQFATLPDGTQRLGYRERRPAKTWAEPIELEDGRHAVPYREDRLAVLADREVTVGGQRLRVPRPDEAIDLEVATDENGDPITREDGSVVLRERVRTEEPVDGPTRTR